MMVARWKFCETACFPPVGQPDRVRSELDVAALRGRDRFNPEEIQNRVAEMAQYVFVLARDAEA